MNGLLLLLYCVEILSAAENTPRHNSTDSKVSESDSTSLSLTTFSSTPTSPSPGQQPANITNTTTTSAVTASDTATTITTTTTTAATAPPTSASDGMFFKRGCVTVYMVTGGLILACTILLVSTLMLACKVGQLSRRLKMLSSNTDLISNSTEYRKGTAKDNNKSEPEAKETTMLMADISQTQEDTGDNGTTKEEREKVDEDGQIGEENKKELGGIANSEEVSAGENKKEPPVTVTVPENSSPSQPQDDTTNSQSTDAVEASSSEGTEEPKDVV